jgi:hypothetical protein
LQTWRFHFKRNVWQIYSRFPEYAIKRVVGENIFLWVLFDEWRCSALLLHDDGYRS